MTRRLLGLDLAPGYTKGNLWSGFTLGLLGTSVITFLPAAQPYVLTEILGLAADTQGRVTGHLQIAAEVGLIASLAWYGALSDRVGRRAVAVAGLALCALGAALYPYAGGEAVLIALRVLFALGIAALHVTMSAIVVDYVRDHSRGKSYGLLGLFSGIGAVVSVLVLVRLPTVLERGGMSPEAAGRTGFLIVAALTLLGALVLRFTLSPSWSARSEPRVRLTTLVAQGVKLARDPGVALSYAASFVARADLALVASFLSLWIADHARTERGMSATEAVARAGAVVGIAYTVIVLGAPLYGWLGDRMKRQNVVILAQAVAAAAYLSTLLVGDPLGPGMMIVAAFIGLGEIGVITTAGPLLAQQVPARYRGSSFGVQILCGAIGIFVVSGVGGWLYDLWRPAAPFALSGACGLLVVLFGLAVRRRVVPHPEADEEREPAGLS
ncbi:MFS transporter [Thermoactinospora rubra]|uniref:MFS transporter n=1 Tax=Thermoactinospora rubra TaxID=1088767 RepID=UPI000A0F71C3|nr:MFS transporter [Thermoactinospora rubra]